MFKLIAITFAGLYVVLLVLGDETRRPDEVSRAASPDLALVQVAAVVEDENAKAYAPRISDREAIALAIAAGKDARQRQQIVTQIDVSTSAEPTLMMESAQPEKAMWYVTGNRVNLRGGPSTSNSVVALVREGQTAEVLSEADGWYEIRLTDGSATGWIFGTFLDSQPSR